MVTMNAVNFEVFQVRYGVQSSAKYITNTRQKILADYSASQALAAAAAAPAPVPPPIAAPPSAIPPYMQYSNSRTSTPPTATPPPSSYSYSNGYGQSINSGPMPGYAQPGYGQPVPVYPPSQPSAPYSGYPASSSAYSQPLAQPTANPGGISYETLLASIPDDQKVRVYCGSFALYISDPGLLCQPKLIQILSMTREQVNALPPADRAGILTVVRANSPSGSWDLTTVMTSSQRATFGIPS